MVIGINSFRAAWRYRRLPAGDHLLETRKGLSPAFMNLVAAIGARAPTSFGQLANSFPALHPDDLELWLAELCRMGLIAPAACTAIAAPSLASPDQLAPRLNAIVAAAVSAKRPGQVAPLKSPAPPEQSPLPAPAALACVLLLDQSPEQRRRWRAALAALPIVPFEAATLEEVEALFNQHLPGALVMGNIRSDFKPLHLLSLLKHPRKRYGTKVFLMLEPGMAPGSPEDLRCARLADVTLPADAQSGLAEEMALHLLGLPRALSAPAGPERPAPALSVAQRLLYAGTAEPRAQVAVRGQLSCLERDYPRVALELADLWRKPALGAFLENLVLDNRGDRQGFAAEAMEELLLLHAMHAQSVSARQEPRRHGIAQARERYAT